MKYNFLILAMGALAFIPEAKADRLLELPPIHVETVHGGTYSSQICITADMNLQPASYISSSVASAHHWFNFSFRNVSTVSQTVRLIVGAGSRTRSRYSSGMNPVPDASGASVNVSADVPINFTLPPGDARTIAVYSTCSPSTCGASFAVLDGAGNNMGGGVVAGAPPPAAGAGAVACLAIDSSFQFKIAITENRGAVTATFTGGYHRNLGLVDKAVTPIPSYPINGGRPF